MTDENDVLKEILNELKKLNTKINNLEKNSAELNTDFLKENKIVSENEDLSTTIMPLSINNPRAIIIPVIDVWCRGSPIALHPIITKHTEKGSIKVTIIAGLKPKKNRLILKTKNIAKEKLFISSLNFFVV